MKLGDTGATGGDADTDTDTDSDTDTDVDTSWATVESCGDRHAGGFNDWVAGGGQAFLVHGNSEEDAQLGSDTFESYADLVGDSFDSFELRAEADLTADERTANLFVVGYPDTQPLLAEMDGSLPVRFTEDGFVFGGQLWDEPQAGLALDHPNPFASDTMVLVFAGNSFAGASNTFTVMTGRHDYHVVSGRGALAVEGDLCTDTTPWSVVTGG
ncbi:MAG: hypothetical protein Q8P41_31040 [Pseudomonadota bacterium]|nr:hypothetical protein [Pseudomonadota bacterium]